MSHEIFSIPSSQFTVSKNKNNVIHWDGHFQGQEVIAALPIGENSQCIILLNWFQNKKPIRQNLLCARHNGDIIWKIALPNSHDFVVGAQIAGDELFINTWNGYRMKIDQLTGRILSSEFVK